MTTEINKLNLHKLRRVMNYHPPHFTKVTFDQYVPENKIIDWVYENLQGRFAAYPVTVDNSRVLQYCVSFELDAEAAYFGLVLPAINSP
jgi:hypothetical protein